MKRTKNFLSVIVALLLAFVMAFALVACNNDGNDGGSQGGDNTTTTPDKSAGDLGITEGPEGESLSLLGITITTLPRTIYNLNQEFTSTGLVVRATYLDSTVAPDPLNPDANLKTEAVAAADYKIDNSDFDNTRVGIYNIYVSYTYLGVTRTASYQVTVNAEDPAYGGIIAELSAGATDTYYLTADAPSVVIPQEIVAVYKVQEDGTKAETALEADAYTAELYLGSKKIENNEATENGTYSLVVTLKDDATAQDFIPVYVVNPVTKIELDKSTGVFTQDKGLNDNISGTWQFTLTYANGLTKTIKSGAEGLTIEVEPNVAGNNKTATVTYVEAGITVTCEVTYTIKAPGGAVTNEYSLNIAELVAAIEARTGAAIADKTALAASDFTGSNAFLTLVEGSGSSDQYRTNNGGLIEIKGDRLQVTFEGTGTLTVSFASTGGSNESHFGLKNAAGSYVAAASTTAEAVTDGDDAGTYSVTGTAAVTVTYEITEAGTYTLCSPAGVTTRGCRITAISMLDSVGGSSPAVTSNYSLNVAELVAAIEARTGAAIADKTALAASDFTGSNAFLTLVEGSGSSDQYRTNNGGLIEIKGDRLQVTFEGTGTLTVSFASTGGSNESHFGLKNAAGSYVAAASTTAEAVTDGDDAGTYSVTGTAAVTVTYEITEAGTYTLCSPAGVTTRGCRITAISMTDTVGGTGGGSTQPVGEPITINIGELVAAGTLSATSISESQDLGANDFVKVSVLANAENTVAVDSNSKSYGGFSFTHRLKLSGAGSDRARSLKIEANGAARITLYVISSNGTSPGGDRELGLFQGVKSDDPEVNTWAAVGEIKPLTAGNSIVEMTFDITEAGTYYLAAVTGGTNIYGITVTPIG